MVALGYPFRIYDMRKAVSALIPYAFFLERSGQPGMADAILRAARASSKHRKFLWNRIGPYVVAMFDKPNPPSLSWLLELAVPLRGRSYNENVPTRRATTSTHTGEVGRSVVTRLLRVVFSDPLRPQTPDGFPEQSNGAGGDLIRQIRALGDIEILKAYLLIVWSGYDPIDDQSGGLAEMLTSIRGEFSGIGMGHHRGDLIERLNYILGRYESLEFHDGDVQLAKQQYEELRRVLLEVDMEAVNTLRRTSPNSTLFSLLALTHTDRIPQDLHVCYQAASPMTVVSPSETWGWSLQLTTSSVHHLLCPCFFPFPFTFV